MLHPDTELRFINQTIGYGVVATKLIPRGSIVWVMDKLDRVLTQHKVEKLGEAYFESLKKYCFRDNRGRWVLCWDLARYVNHSFDPSCLTTAFDFELAVRDIQPGEQITNHYGYLNLDPMMLLNDEGTESKLVSSKDLLFFFNEWDQKLRKAFELIETVNQPLSPLLTRKMHRQVRAVKKDPSKMASIKNCFYDSHQ